KENWELFSRKITECSMETKQIKIIYEQEEDIKERSKNRFTQKLGNAYEYLGGILNAIVNWFRKKWSGNKSSDKKDINYIYTARIEGVFADEIGKGGSPEEAEKNLIDKIKNAGKPNPPKRKTTL